MSLCKEPGVCLITVKGRTFRKALPEPNPKGAAAAGNTHPSKNAAAQRAVAVDMDEDEPNTCKMQINDTKTNNKAAAATATKSDEIKVHRELGVNSNVSKHIPKKGALISKCKKELGVDLTFLPNGQINISGPNGEAVESAETRVLIAINEAIQAMPYTHFLSVPLNDKSFNVGLQAFYQKIASQQAACRGVEPSIFVDPRRLHLTLAMLKLSSQDMVKQATALLQSTCATFTALRKKQGQSASLKLELKGIEIMNDDPSDAHVLYAKLAPCDDYELLQQLSIQLVKSFHTAGLISEEELDKQRIRQTDGTLKIKFHATIFNTKHRNSSQQQSARISFDAVPLLSSLGATPITTGTADSIHLSVLGPVNRDGFYVAHGKGILR